MNDNRKDCPMRHENGNCTVIGGFCTAVNDPICDGLHNAYDLGFHYAAIRYQQKHGWVSVNDELPKREKHSEPWKRYNVVVLRSHWPTSSYDSCDAPYDEEFVTTAAYDSEQKIWHLAWGEQLNALIDIEDSPLNGDYVTHWMPLPEHPKEDSI